MNSRIRRIQGDNVVTTLDAKSPEKQRMMRWVTDKGAVVAMDPKYRQRF